MKRYAVRLGSSAQEQIALIRVWWLSNRPKAPALFDRELDEAMKTLAEAPLVSSLYRTGRGYEVRRVLLSRSGYAIYFIVDGEHVDVAAVWHTARGSGPPLV